MLRPNHPALPRVVFPACSIEGVTAMADDRTLKGPQDRSKISLSEDYEVRYWCEKFGVTGAELRAAIKKIGNSTKAVEAELRK